MWSLDEHRKRYKANLIAGCEAQTNWYQVPDGQRFEDIVGLGEHTRCKATHNIHDKTRYQPGGTVIATFGQTSGYDMKMGKDKTGLGQWVWTVFGTGTTRRRIVSAYRPSVPSTLKGRCIDFKAGTKVYEQQYRYYQRINYHNCDPFHNFDTNLLALLSLWRMRGKEVLLMIDLNKNIYTGNFAKALAEQDILMDEVFHRVNNTRSPNSHITSSDPIYVEFLHHQGLTAQDILYNTMTSDLATIECTI